MTARIYREDGSWWSTQPDPSGGEIRCRYPSGQAAMVALDPRNREKAEKPPSIGLMQAIPEAFKPYIPTERIAPEYVDDLVRQILHDSGHCPPSTPTTKDCE